MIPLAASLRPQAAGSLGGIMSDFTCLKMWRLQQGLSQLQAARKIGFGEMTYSYIESGRLKPSEAQKNKLTTFFRGVNLDALLQSPPEICPGTAPMQS